MPEKIQAPKQQENYKVQLNILQQKPQPTDLPGLLAAHRIGIASS
jgi:hypothetical protein